MLSDKAGTKLVKYVSDYVVFDLETTGMSPVNDAVIEISAVKVVGGKVVEEFSTLVNPLRPIPYGASKVNNIYDEMVKDAPVFEEALTRFLEFAQDNVLVGHNIHGFDMKFLYNATDKYWGQTIGNDYIDTLQLAKKCLPHMAHRTLVDLATHYGFSAAGAHRALADCHMNQKVFEELGKELDNPDTEARKGKKCPRCGSMLKLRNGMYGEFWGCMAFPGCRYTENV